MYLTGRVPPWLTPSAGISPLSYHADPDRWFQDAQGNHLLRSVAKGQEFVFDTHNHPPALSWVSQLIAAGLSVAPPAHCAVSNRKKSHRAPIA